MSIEAPKKAERPAKKRRGAHAKGTMPPPMEAKPSAKDDIEELPQELLKEEPPAVPTSKDTMEALADMKASVEDAAEEQAEWETKSEAGKAAAEAAEERQRFVEARDKENFSTAHAIMEARKNMENVPDMTDEARFEDPKEDFEHRMEKGWTDIAGRHLKDRAEAMKAVESLEHEEQGEEKKDGKKPWWKRLFGAK